MRGSSFLKPLWAGVRSALKQFQGRLSSVDRVYLWRANFAVIGLSAGAFLCLFLGCVIRSEWLAGLLDRLGVGLIAGAVTSFVLQLFMFHAESSRITVEALDRGESQGDHAARMYAATKIDSLSMSAHGSLEQLDRGADTNLIKGFLRRKAHIRFLFVSPDAALVPIRARADSKPEDELRKMLRDGVNRSLAIAKAIRDCARENPGLGTCVFEVRLTDECPHIWIFRTDKDLRWGPYTADATALPSPSLLVNQGTHSDLFDKLMTHFERLWERGMAGTSCTANQVVRYDGSFGLTSNQEMLKKIGCDCPEIEGDVWGDATIS